MCVRVCVCVCEEKNMRLSVRGNLRTCIDEATNFSGSKFFFFLVTFTFLQIYFYRFYKSGPSVFWT